MHRLQRDILFQLLSVFLLALGATTFMTLTAVLLREAGDRQLSYSLILRLVPYILPDALRFAIPATILFAACLVFGRMSSANEIVAVGAPLAIRRRHGEFWTTFFLCFLPILIVYYPLFMVAFDRAKLGEWPPQTIWLGNAMLLVWSAWLIRRVIRYCPGSFITSPHAAQRTA